MQAGSRRWPKAVESALPVGTPANLVSLLLTAPHLDLCTQAGGFRKYQKKGKWRASAKLAGLSQADGDRLNDLANIHYARCCGAWLAVQQSAASHSLAALIPLVRPVMDRFRDYKRSAALLDFDDLIFAARDLLRDHDDVCRALAERFTRVLVDEFQDTRSPADRDILAPLRRPGSRCAPTLTGRPSRSDPAVSSSSAIPSRRSYRFRGADIAAYVRAREAFRTQSVDGVLSIANNFRSCAPIMNYVNDRFEHLLSEESGQPRLPGP